MILLGLTGGIASGKSTVSKLLQQDYGAHIIDADQIARSLSEPGQIIHSSLALSFRAEGKYETYFNNDDTLNRKALANLMFNNPQIKKTIEDMMHHHIVCEILIAVGKCKIEQTPLVVIDAPLLIEVGLHKIVQKVIVVDIDPELQVQRLMNRNAFTKKEAMLRIQNQMPAQELLSYADCILTNSGSEEELKENLQSMMQSILSSTQGE